MANQFDIANANTAEPREITAGDFVQWKKADIAADYPTSAGYTAQYVARIEGGVEEFKISQDVASDDNAYVFSAASAATATYLPGVYRWQLEITQTASGNRVVVATGKMQVRPDMDISNADSRSHAEIMLGKIESLLVGKADADVSSYSIAGRSLTKLNFSELMEARNFYKSEVLAEKAKKEQEERTRRLNAILTVSLFDKGYVEVNYQDYITYKFAFENKSDKDIKAFKGYLAIKDLFDATIKEINITYDDGVPAGEVKNWNATTDYNQFHKEDQQLRSKDMEDLKLVWTPEKVIFSDGSEME